VAYMRYFTKQIKNTAKVRCGYTQGAAVLSCKYCEGATFEAPLVRCNRSTQNKVPVAAATSCTIGDGMDNPAGICKSQGSS
jgi:hypothetical protein